jgi:peptidoglycan hydrolase-like protein with peptidoglycan-binding domain
MKGTIRVTAGVLATAGILFPLRSEAAPVATAKVARTDLSTTQQLFGTLGFADAATIVATTGGTAYTWLPAPGAVIAQGQPLYEVDGTPIPLLNGARPEWRDLAVGVPPGPDVAQLNTDLDALGYAAAPAEDRYYTVQTAAAVRRWQLALGVPVTGRLDRGQLAFAPGPVRVQTVQPQLGAPPRPGEPLMTVTATTRDVDLPVPVDQAYLVHAQDAVTVTLPDARSTTAGTVAAVSPVATTPSDNSGGRPATPVIDVTVRLSTPDAVAAYTSAPVSVTITTGSAHGVLAVPITALVARPDGGFAVTVVSGGERRQVPVTTGMFTDTLVEVTGVADGATVEVPSS